MDIVVAGSHGLIGTELSSGCASAGTPCAGWCAVRRRPRTSTSGILTRTPWTPRARGCGRRDQLCRGGVGDHRWTAEYKRTILESRTRTTGLLARTLGHLDAPRPSSSRALPWATTETGARRSSPRRRVPAQASSPGRHRVGERHATRAGRRVRVAHLRTGIVMAPDGGALYRMLPCCAGVWAGSSGAATSTGAGSRCATTCRRCCTCSTWTSTAR
ncbi:hypothetical protein NKG05_26230 [Oerskovia sp. M15]